MGLARIGGRARGQRDPIDSKGESAGVLPARRPIDEESAKGRAGSADAVARVAQLEAAAEESVAEIVRPAEQVEAVHDERS